MLTTKVGQADFTKGEVGGGHGVEDNCVPTSGRTGFCPKYRMISCLNPEAEASFDPS